MEPERVGRWLGLLAVPALWERFMLWRENDPRWKNTSNMTEKEKMQRQYTLEIRTNFSDEDKNTSMRQKMAALARNGYATANLLKDPGQPEPQVAIWSDDFFGNHSEIGLMEDVIQQGTELLDSMAPPDAQEDGVNQELLDALKPNVK